MSDGDRSDIDLLGMDGESRAEADMPTAPVMVIDRPPPATGDEWSPPRPQPPSVRAGRVAANVLIALCAVLAGFLLFVFVLSSFSEARTQTGLERRIAKPLAQERQPIGGAIPLGTPVARLQIPAVGLQQVVVEGATSDELRKGPGHVPATPLPGQVGNAVLAGHREAWGGPFGSIASLKPGAIISVLTGQGRFTYRVSSVRIAKASDTSVFDATTDNRLTLITSASLSASRRVVVVAGLVGKAVQPPATRVASVGPLEDGLTAQTSAFPALLLFAEVLLGVAVVAVVTYRRLPRVSSYIITTPVILATLWLFYENLARLLPATL